MPTGTRTEAAFTVGAIARLAGVTVRTLHHYDEIGLVSPVRRTGAGYRLYGRAEIERLQEVLFFRELGFGLGEIRRIVEEPGYQRAGALAHQRELLEARAGRLFALIEAIDRAMDTTARGTTMTPEEMLEVFGDFNPAGYQDEIEERWGGTDAYAESTRRVSRYTKTDWLRIQDEADAINQGCLELMARGVAPDSEAAMDLAERHRAHITRWFYECTPEIHAGLGQMYLADHRFKGNIDKVGEGLAAYLSAAIDANHRRS